MMTQRLHHRQFIFQASCLFKNSLLTCKTIEHASGKRVLHNGISLKSKQSQLASSSIVSVGSNSQTSLQTSGIRHCNKNTIKSTWNLVLQSTSSSKPTVNGAMYAPSIFNMKPPQALDGRYQLRNSLHTTSIIYSEKKQEQQNYTPIYRYKYIVLFKTLSRAKIYQTFFTFAAIGPVIRNYMAGNLSPQITFCVLGASAIAGIMLYVMSLYIRRTVGILSINNDCTILRLSHLTFWGKRNNVLIPVNDIVPFADASESARNIYQIITLYSKPEKWYIFSHHGSLNDAVSMETIFGKLN